MNGGALGYAFQKAYHERKGRRERPATPSKFELRHDRPPRVLDDRALHNAMLRRPALSGAVHAPRIAVVDFRRLRPCRLRRPRVRQGQRDHRHGARAARPRPDGGARRSDRRDHPLQHLRGPDEDQRGLLGDPAARREVDLLARPQDADLCAQAERQVPGWRAFHVKGRQVLLRAVRGQGFDQQGQGLLRLDRIRSKRPTR